MIQEVQLLVELEQVVQLELQASHLFVNSLAKLPVPQVETQAKVEFKK